jgi:hypothetical protein
MERIFVNVSLLTGYGLNVYLFPVNRMKESKYIANKYFENVAKVKYLGKNTT